MPISVEGEEAITSMDNEVLKEGPGKYHTNLNIMVLKHSKDSYVLEF